MVYQSIIGNMYNFNVINPWFYKFNTNVGSEYSVLFKKIDLQSVEIFLQKEKDNNDPASAIYEIMQTVASIINFYLNRNNSNKLVLNVTGKDDREITKKKGLYVKYMNNLLGQWKPELDDSDKLLFIRLDTM